MDQMKKIKDSVLVASKSPKGEEKGFRDLSKKGNIVFLFGETAQTDPMKSQRTAQDLGDLIKGERKEQGREYQINLQIAAAKEFEGQAPGQKIEEEVCEQGKSPRARKDPVVAIKDLQTIEMAKCYFYQKDERYRQLKLRNYLLFVMGINVGLRGGDLTRIKISDVLRSDGALKDSFVLYEEKTGKRREVTFHPVVKDGMQFYLNTRATVKRLALSDYLFESRNRGDKGSSPITLRQAQNIMKELQRELELEININTHSMRKTFGYHKVKNNPSPHAVATLQKVFGHSCEKITLSYIGVDDDMVKDFYLSGGL